MDPQEINDLLIRIDERTEHHTKQLGEICTLAKSKDGFGRCQKKDVRIKHLERYQWLIVGCLLLGSVKMIFF
jgi:hypothetical protein